MRGYSVIGSEVPSVSTKRIVLHDSSPFKIEVQYRLMLKQGPAVRNNGNYKNMHLHLLVLNNDEMSNILPSLTDPKYRSRMLSKIYNENLYNLSSKKAAVYYPLEKMYSDSSKIINKDNTQELHNSVTIDYGLHGRPKRRVDPSIHDSSHSFELLDTSKLHLVCFVDAPPGDGTTPALFGNLNYDLLLEQKSNAQGEPVLGPPKYRKSFFVDDINFPDINLMPYNGPAHYHSENNPGPRGYRDQVLSPRTKRRGYVGWMGGHEKGEMGPRLRVSESLNQKIQTSGNLKKTLRRKIENTQTQSHIQNHPILEKYSDETAYTRVLQDNDGLGGISDNSHYGCLIGLNILNALKMRSKFAKYVKIHEENQNHDILFSIIKRSKIQDLSVNRRRLQSSGTKRGRQQSKKTSKFSKNTKTIKLISSEDKKNRNNEMQSVRNNVAALHQVDLTNSVFDLDINNSYYTRMININDYDLFHNIKVGNYTYEVDLSMKDGVISYFKSLVKRLRIATMRMKRYQQICTEPASYDANHKLMSGNYDYTRKHAVGSFAKSKQYNSFLNKVILLYAEVCKFLSGESLKQEDVNNMKSCLSPGTLNLNYLESFVLQLMSSSQVIVDILSSNSNIVLTPPYGNLNKTSKYGDRVPQIPEALQYRINTNININAENKNHICTDHNITPLRNKNILSISDINNSLTSFYIDKRFKEPRRFVKIQTSPYEIDRKRTYKTNINESDRAYERTISKNNSQISKGHINTMMERGEFYSSNHGIQSNFETKILALKQPGASTMGIGDKPESYYPTFLQNRGNSFVFTVSGFSDNFIHPEAQVSTLRKIVHGARPDATDELIKTLHEALITTNSEEELAEVIEQKYHSLIKLKERLGKLYSRLHLAFNIKKNFIKKNNKQKYKDLYLSGKATTDKVANKLEEERSVFSVEKACLYSIIPGVGKVKINPRELVQMSNKLKRGGNQYLFIKVEHEEKSFKLPLINDGFLVRV
jgi:hypothetical protein